MEVVDLFDFPVLLGFGLIAGASLVMFRTLTFGLVGFSRAPARQVSRTGSDNAPQGRGVEHDNFLDVMRLYLVPRISTDRFAGI